MSDDDAAKPLTAEEVGVFLDRMRADLGREPSPSEVVDRVLDPRDDFEKRAQHSFELNPERGHRLYLVSLARQFIRRERRVEVVVADGATVEIPRSVSDPELREHGSNSYVTVEVTDAGELAANARAAVARSLRSDLVSRVRANEYALREFGCWGEASTFVAAVEAATLGVLDSDLPVAVRG